MERNNLLIKLLGFSATLIQGDTLVLDRWNWLKDKMPISNLSENALDVGCGSGAFTLGLAKRGYNVIGLTWDQNDTAIAVERAKITKTDNCKFIIQDVRKLDERKEFINSFNKIVCTENIEHILNDQKLMKDMSACLKKGAKLYLTTPSIDFIAITPDDDGPFETVENGWHVRRGYSKQDLERLCAIADLDIISIGFVSGFFSQKVTRFIRILNKTNKYLSFVLTFPFRILPLVFDKYIKYPGYSISLIAQKK